MTAAPVLEICGLEVRYGGTPAVAGIDLSVAAGETVALLGANGAGKSTILKAIVGLAPATGGSIRLGGTALDSMPIEARARLGVGYCPEERRIFPGLTVRENLEVAAAAGGRERRRRLAEVVRLFPQLAQSGSARAWRLSGGQQQMLAIGRALMTAPRLLLLDEPSIGLAGPLAIEVLDRLAEINRAGTAVLLAEQNVAGASAAAHRVCIVASGRIVWTGPADAVDADMLAAAYLGERKF